MMRAIQIVLALMALLAALPSFTSAQAASNTCDDYTTQEDAQAAFDRDPDRMWELDDDGDGIACEHLPARSSGGTSVFPWIAGGVLVLGAALGVFLARRRRSRPKPSSETPVLAGIYPEYDPEVELELQLIRAEREAEGDGPPRAPEHGNRA